MSTQASISSGPKFYLYLQELAGDQPRSIFLELNDPQEFRAERETFSGKSSNVRVVEISSEGMDKIAIDWINKRKLKGAVGGPIGAEWGSPDCPWQ